MFGHESNPKAMKRKRPKRIGRKLLMVFFGLVLSTAGVLHPKNINAAACSSSGTDVTISVDCEFAAGTYVFGGTLTIASGVTVTMQGDTGAGTGVTLIAGNFDIQGTITADAQGYLGGNGGTASGAGPGGGDGVSGFARGASYGGQSSGNSKGEYGSAYAPIDLGSGGGDDGESGAGGNGGGAFKLFVNGSGTLTLGDGAILSADSGNSGTADQGGGSGGSIWIDAPNGSVVIASTHTATVRARGGTTGGRNVDGSGGTSDGGGPGGGGRIAIYAGTCTNCDNITFDARGGIQGTQSGAYPEGGPGSIFKKLNGATNGDLIFDNNNFVGAATTELVASSTNIVDNFIVRNGADVSIPSGFSVELASGGDLTGGGTEVPVLAIQQGATFDSSSSTFLVDDMTLYHYGDMPSMTNLVIEDAIYYVQANHTTYSAQGDNRLDDLTVRSGGFFVNGDLGTFYLENMTVESGGSATHIFNQESDTEFYKLIVSATSSIDIQSGGSVDVASRGHQGSAATIAGYGPGGGGTGGFSGGGGYGAEGGHDLGTDGDPYGSVTQPTHLGSAGGNDGESGTSGDGGGAIKLSVNSGGTITIDGTIDAGGGNASAADHGGGSGGSIWIDATGGTIAGSGSFDADGGNAISNQGGGGGSGGRIAVYYGTDNSSWTYSNAGGTDGSQSGSEVDAGGAGTIFLKADAAANGDLIIDADNEATPNQTHIIETDTFDNITVRDGAKLDVDSGLTLTLASGGVLTGGGTQQPIFTISDGSVFDSSSSTFLIDDLDTTVNGDFATTSSLVLWNGDYEFGSTGAFTVGGGLTLITLDNANVTDSGPSDTNNTTSLTVTSGNTYTLNTEEYYPFATAFTDLTVHGTFVSQRLSPLYVENLHVTSGGTLTHGENSTTEAYKLDISATSTIDIDSGGSVDVDARGYSTGSTNQADGNGPGGGDGKTGFAGGAGYGGEGGHDFTTFGNVYGSPTQPDDLGSSGGNDEDSGDAGDGGGAIKLSVNSGGTITIDGTITADGGSATSSGDNGGGSGGSIWINAVGGTIAGTTSFTAIGGNGWSNQGGGGGGGGRIAIYYGTNSATWTYDAAGGSTGTQSTESNGDGGAGTVYIKSDAAANGDLIVDNNGIDNANDTIPVGASETYDNITISDGSKYILESGDTLTIASGGSLTGGGTVQPTLTISDGATFNAAGGSFTINDVDVTHSGDFSTVTSLTVTDATYTFDATADFTAGGGVTTLTLSSNATFDDNGGSNLNLSSLTVPTGSIYILDDESYYPWATNFGALSVSGTFRAERYGTLFVDSLTVPSGGKVTHVANSSTFAYRVDVSATSTIDIQSGGSIDVDGKGYASAEGPGKGTTGGNSNGGGGAYGGDGGTASSPAPGGESYGSMYYPENLGSGGGEDTASGTADGATGGGNVKLSIGSGGTITLNGTITADGGTYVNNNHDGGGGAGGGVWIDAATNTVAGTGTITANGSACEPDQGCGGGGGGRIAIYYTTGDPENNWTLQAYGGNGGNQSGTFGYRYGAAGTIYIKDYAESNGDIIVDNNNSTYKSRWTRLSGLSLINTFRNIKIRNGACFRIPNSFKLRRAIGGLFSFSGASRPCIKIDSGGVLDPNDSSFTVGDVDIDSAGDLEGVTDMTVTNSSISNTTTFSSGCNTVTLGSGGNLNFISSATFTCATLTVQSGGSVTHDTVSSIDETDSGYIKIMLDLTALDLQSGGTIDADESGFARESGPGQGGQGHSCGGGGGHGGAGGAGSCGTAPGGTTYDDQYGPNIAGSGGADDQNEGDVGGAGGGLIKIVVSASATIAGEITADGETRTSGTQESGGGSGGGIWLELGTWSGSGVISADGGSGAGSGSTGGGCGGGGIVYIKYDTKTYSGTSTAAAGTDCTGSTAGEYGLVTEVQSLAIDSVSHSPSTPEVGDDVYLACQATGSGANIKQIDIYLDGTDPEDKLKTCTISPTTLTANCDVQAGSLTAGAHTTTCIATDENDATAQDTDNFTVINRTQSNTVTLGSSKVGVTTTGSLNMTFSATSSGSLTVEFPSEFTVSASATDAASDDCFTNFGWTSSTLTATKTDCNGTVSFGGFTVTNPSSAGTYVITWENDTGSAQVTIVDDDQFTISASVAATITFNVGAQASATACDGTFSGNGGTVAFGELNSGAVASSDLSSVSHICLRFSTNASSGAVVTVVSANGAMSSASTPADTIPSSTATLAAGTEGYGLCVGSDGADSGTDSTTPTSASVTRASPFNTTCTASDHNVGGVTTSSQTVVSASGPTQNAFARVYMKAAIADTTTPHDDYTDTLTFILTATY